MLQMISWLTKKHFTHLSPSKIGFGPISDSTYGETSLNQSEFHGPSHIYIVYPPQTFGLVPREKAEPIKMFSGLSNGV